MSANETLRAVCDAGLFDLDGVLTPTATVHMLAWSRMFNAFLSDRAARTGADASTRAYTDEDYFAHVDGKPRYDGVRDFLASRGIVIPDGDPADPPEADTVCGLGNRKNTFFARVLTEDGVAPYPGSVLLLDHLAALGVPLAVVSSSQNAEAVLAAAGLRDRFALVVDGRVARARGLAGKPSPATYTWAAETLGVPRERAVVFEDAVSGVAAGRAGGFGLVVGVDRGVGADELRAHGADLVVSDLSELLP
ncbi:MAG: HAD-IA family hydrolase [Actinobacteria bacterium]|nr:HAD-IA family hydrolase [Actinomycetota bacterium]